MQLTSVIIDDEKPCRDSLQLLLDALHPEITIKGSADRVSSGIDLVKEIQPDILFLDIELPDGTGFDLLEQLKNYHFATIFVTAHNHYARLAFDFAAMAYLNKPVGANNLSEAIHRARERVLIRTQVQQMEDFREVNQNFREKKLPTRLAVSNSNGIHYIPIDNITFLTVDKGCTEIYQSDGSRVIVSANLIEYERRFAEFPNFLKIHKSYTVNLHYISIYRPSGELLLTTGQILPVSQRHLDDLKHGMDGMSL